VTSFKKLYDLLGYHFKDESLLREALTHSSKSGSANLKSNERLEFLGDRVLGLVIAQLLFEKFPSETEGDLAKRHSALVSRETLAGIGQNLQLTSYIHMARTGGQMSESTRQSVLANGCEAVIAALYLDGGFEQALSFIKNHWEPLMGQMIEVPIDDKSKLQEWLQARKMKPPHYQIISQTGPDHLPEFVVAVTIEGLPQVTGKGTSKRKAEQEAARTLLTMLKEKE
jgi:ribonuclease-3